MGRIGVLEWYRVEGVTRCAGVDEESLSVGAIGMPSASIGVERARCGAG